MEGGPPESAGRPLELAGDGRSRWMVAAGAIAPVQDPAYRSTRPPPLPKAIPTANPYRRFLQQCSAQGGRNAMRSTPKRMLSAAGRPRRKSARANLARRDGRISVRRRMPREPRPPRARAAPPGIHCPTPRPARRTGRVCRPVPGRTARVSHGPCAHDRYTAS